MAGETISGVNAVREALEQPGTVNRVLFAKESRAAACKALLEEARTRRVPFDFVPQAKLNTLAGTREHQGVVAQISPVHYETLDTLLGRCGPTSTLLVLDRVQHPKNLGMIIRSAAGAGVAGIVLAARGGALLDESVVRASAGTVLRVPVATCRNLSQGLRRIREAGFWVYGLDASGETDVFDMRWPDRVALVAGNETSGMRAGIRKNCDGHVAIPLANGVESLNVAVAAAVVLFQARRGARP